MYVRQNFVYERVIEASDGIEFKDDNRSSYEPRLWASKRRAARKLLRDARTRRVMDNGVITVDTISLIYERHYVVY